MQIRLSFLTKLTPASFNVHFVATQGCIYPLNIEPAGEAINIMKSEFITPLKIHPDFICSYEATGMYTLTDDSSQRCNTFNLQPFPNA